MATTNQQNTIYHEPAVEALRRVAERDDVAAVVLRVDSGGGDALASCAALIDSQCRPER
jgi:ClpP class serine protease